MSARSLWAGVVGLWLLVGVCPTHAQPPPDSVRSSLHPPTLPSPAAPDTTLRLDALLRAAAKRNPSLQAARLRAEARATESAQAGALPDPMVGGTYFPYSVVTARGKQRTQWRVQQSIPFPGTRRLRSTVADLGADVADAEADALGQSLALRIRRAYYTLVRIQAHERYIRRFQADLEQFEEAALTQYEVGEEGQPAVLKAQIERRRLDTQLESLAAERRSVLQTLARLTGRERLADADAHVQVMLPDSIPIDSSEAMQRRPEAQALRTRIDQSDRKIDLAKKESWPDFTVGAQYFDIAETTLTPMMNGRDALALSVGVTVPLWRDKQRAQVQEAQIERQQAESELEAFRLEVHTRMDDLHHQIERQRRQLSILDETLLPKAETALEATLSAYQTGQSDFLDLLDAERTLFQLRLDRASVYARLLTTMAELERTAGRAALSPTSK